MPLAFDPPGPPTAGRTCAVATDGVVVQHECTVGDKNSTALSARSADTATGRVVATVVISPVTATATATGHVAADRGIGQHQGMHAVDACAIASLSSQFTNGSVALTTAGLAWPAMAATAGAVATHRRANEG